MDYLPLFVQTLYEEMEDIFEAHGIDSLHEEQMEDIVRQCKRDLYIPTIREFRRLYVKDSLVPKSRDW